MRAQLKQADAPSQFNCDSLIIPLFKDGKLSAGGREVDRVLQRQISTLLKREEFAGNPGETLVLHAPAEVKAMRIVLWGLGDKTRINNQQWVNTCTALANTLKKLSGAHCAVLLDQRLPRALAQDWAVRQISCQLTRSTYRYTETKADKSTKKTALSKITVLNSPAVPSAAKLKTALNQGVAIGEGINLTRLLGDLPGNICTPKYLSAEARKLARKSPDLQTKILGEKKMAELGMGSLLSVGHGSDQESQFIIMEYRGGKKTQNPHVLVGKGITFDTGGISLKPGAKMDEMKFDMCGAASVLGTMQALVAMKLPLNVTGVIAAAENMPSGRATKPGDVVTSMAGKTIEVLNTDAEGRLVLCDALHYVKRFKPASVVDMATLTGACIVALGFHATGLLSNNDELADSLLNAGQQSGDRAWRLPLWDEYQKQLQSPFADLANIGGPAAGTITAGCFLSQFAEDYPWAHLDIAGTAWNQGGGKGASGRPVSLLCQYLMNL